MTERSKNLRSNLFGGFPPEALDFFRGLAANQDRAWFADHKADYEQYVQTPFRALLSDLSEHFAEAGLPLRADPARAIFRLHRDVRFSKDKRPYKTHASAAITRDGNKTSPGLLYIHIDPEGSFAAAGFFRPESAILDRLRHHLSGSPGQWAKTLKALGKAALTLSAEDKLTRLPRGFETAPASVHDSIRLKSWIVRKELPQSLIGEPALTREIAAFACSASPLLKFGWEALDGA